MANSNNTSFKHELPLKLFINGKWVDSLGETFLTLTSATDDSVVTNRECCLVGREVVPTANIYRTLQCNCGRR